MTRGLACVVLALGCDAAGSAMHSHRDPDALIVAQAADVIGLDPIRVTDSESIEASELMFEGLVGWKPGTTDLEPRLATAWSVSPDGKAWTFHLRDHVAFHDGTPLDASAVVFSFERLLDPRHPYYVASEQASYWRSLLGAIAQITAIDPLTIEIEVVRPHAPLIADLARFPIVSPSAVQRWGDAFATHPVGTGPFAFEAWRRGDGIVVRRFEGYWGPQPALARIVFQVVADARQRLIDLESGSVDLAVAILPDEQPFVDLHPDLLLARAAGNNVSYLAFNTRRPPFDDVRVRRALALSVDRESLVKNVTLADETPSYNFVPQNLLGFRSEHTFKMDLVEARRLLAEAGYPDGKGFPRVELLYNTLEKHKIIAEALQQMWRKNLGVDITLVNEEWKVYIDDQHSQNFQFQRAGWIADYIDPHVFFDLWETGGGNNDSNWGNPEYDRLLHSALSAPNDATRFAIYQQMEKILIDEMPIIPLYNYTRARLISPRVKGFYSTPLDNYPWKYADIVP